MSEPTRVAELMKELMRLESMSNKLCHRAYKTRNEFASKEWRAYRKVHSRLKVVKKQIGNHLKVSQDTFHSTIQVSRAKPINIDTWETKNK